MRLAAVYTLLLLASTVLVQAADGNRLTYLDGSDPFYVSRSFPKLITPQWVGDEETEAVVILAIDDMKEHEKWEAYLRPILARLKKIDGRAPVSIMTNRIDPRHPHLQTWLKEGVSLEVHTYDHPCPLLQKGSLPKAKETYDRCVDQMDTIPGNRAVAFRMPCCDSQNTPSPRFFAEIFNKTTPAGNFLSIDSSVSNLITANDPQLPRDLVLDEQGREIFRKYVPFKSFVTTIEDYPYPYVIGRLCWEFPCVLPSDWSAQKLQKPNNPLSVRDFQRAVDATVVKQGVFTLIFHPHNWIENKQIVELIDHAVTKHGKKVKFLTFREAQERLDKNLLAGNPLRSGRGNDNGVRLLDVNNDGFVDVVVGNERTHATRIWSPKTKSWTEGSLPAGVQLSDAAESEAHFGVLRKDGFASLLTQDGNSTRLFHFADREWTADTIDLPLPQRAASAFGRSSDRGIRLRDVDGDGICELIVSNPQENKMLALDAAQGWTALPWALPEGAPIVDSQGRDAGLRFVDIDQDGHDDVLSANENGFAAHRFVSREQGWSQKLVAGKPGEAGAVPAIARAGTNNGAWFHGRHLWVQNEDTDKLPDLVARHAVDDLLKDISFPGPKSPEASLAATHARPGFQVELMACEPLVRDPIALAFGADAKLWVCEMGDYPRGADGNGKRGGVVRYLEDTDDDGRYDRSTVFIDELGFPTGIAPWRNGLLITCAPEIIYVEDTDGDGKADKRETLYRNFTPGNPQHRVNGLKWGLDGWMYCAHGHALAGHIQLLKTGGTANANGRDFRIEPDRGLLDPQAGPSQYGRNRDDWGNWFGNENSDPLYQFVLDDDYLRRNPHVPAANGRVDVPEQAGAAEVFPRSRTLARFNDLYAANRFTSANSSMIYRDDLFGPAYAGNAFISEPVHNLVHREVLRPEGVRFVSRRADDERDSEFLASADNWFRPTMLVTGPDGALWVADMYRQTIEHPEWIPPETQKQIDLRAGADMGRIYRVFPIGSRPRKIPRLDQLPLDQLVAAMDSPSGWQRDTVQQLLFWRDEKSAIPVLKKLAAVSRRAECRVQALWTLRLLSGLDAADLLTALKDPHPGVRRSAVKLSEPFLASSPQLGDALSAMASDNDTTVQLQRAYTLGEWKDPRSGTALGAIALRYVDDRFITAAILSSINADNLHGVTTAVLSLEHGQEPPAELLEQLVRLSRNFDDPRSLQVALARIGKPNKDSKYADWQLTALAGLLDTIGEESSWEKYDDAHELTRMFAFARTTTANEEAPLETRLRAVRLLCRNPKDRGGDVASLMALLVPQTPGELQAAAVESLVRLEDNDVPKALLAGWKTHTAAIRSQILDAMLSRDGWLGVLLDAIEARQLPVADIDASRRQRLAKSNVDGIKARTERLLSGSVESNRRQVVEEHASVLQMAADAQAGAATFNKRCAVCHRIRGVGHEVGPNLASLTDYSPPTLLAAILDPNRAVEAKYVDYVAVTSAGLSFTGMMANETGNSVTLLGQEGKQQTILRTDLEVLQPTGKSLMPEGLEKDLTPQDLANIIAYLRGSGAPRKQFHANHPQLVKPTTDGTLQLYATNCEIYGSTIVMERLYKNLGHWQSETDRAVWNIELPKAGRYEMLLNYACLDDTAGNTWLLEAGEKSLTGKVAGTGSVNRYLEVRGGLIDLPAGAQQIVFRSSGPISGNLLQLGGILLKPAPAAAR